MSDTAQQGQDAAEDAGSSAVETGLQLVRLLMFVIRCVPHGIGGPATHQCDAACRRMKVTELGLAVGLLMTDFVIPQ